MIRRRVALFIAFAALPFSAPAQPPAPPDPAALELARLLMARDETLYDDAGTGRMQVRLENRLLESRGTCNPSSLDCRIAARAVAQEFAPVFRQSERTRAELITAYLIADRLPPEEARRTLQYLRGEEGSRLLDTLAALRRPEATEDRRRELERVVARTEPDAFPAAHARFLQRTRYLPRPAPR